MTSISSLNNASATTSGGTGTDVNTPKIGSQDFLRLLITQLQHQDPLTPADPGDTVQQLAALSQVSTLQEINTSITALLADKNQGTDPAGWIGLRALVPSTTALPLSDGSYAGEISVSNSEDVDIVFSDSGGSVIHTEHIAGPTTEPVMFSWDGIANGVKVKGPLQVVATSLSKATTSVAVWTVVASVREPGSGHPMIETALGSFTQESVLDLKPS